MSSWQNSCVPVTMTSRNQKGKQGTRAKSVAPCHSSLSVYLVVVSERGIYLDVLNTVDSDLFLS